MLASVEALVNKSNPEYKTALFCIMNSILYLFVTEQKTSFKIGITDNITDRYMRIKSLWGELDLDASCMVLGDRREVSGLEKTLHFLLDKWRVEHSLKVEGHSEWFAMECFDKAIEIITAAAQFRETKSASEIIYGIKIAKNNKTININRKKREIQKVYDFSNLETLKQLWPEYKNATIDFIKHPKKDDAWLWIIDIHKCSISPYYGMMFDINKHYINPISSFTFYEENPSIHQFSISKNILLIMKNLDDFRPIYEFISSEIEYLIEIVRCKTVHPLQAGKSGEYEQCLRHPDV